MSIRKTLTATAALAGIAAMQLATLGSAAQAYDGRGPDRWRAGDHRQALRHAPPPRHAYDDHRDRRHSRDKSLNRGIAIGIGALILGGILAAEANRQHRYDYD